MEALAEAIRVSERVLDHQLSGLMAQRREAERLVRLGVAAVAGSIAATGLLIQANAGAGWIPIMVAGSGVIGQAVATGVAALPLAGAGSDIGPSPRELFRGFQTGGWTIDELRLALLDRAALAHRYNSSSLERETRRRRAAIAFLLASSAVVVLGLAFVVGGSIHG